MQSHEKETRQGVAKARLWRWLDFASIALVWLVVLLTVAAALAPFLFPSGSELNVGTRKLVVGIIFITSYLALAIGRIPGLDIDRAGIALVGACLIIESGALGLEQTFAAIDIDTITLLLGMMILVAHLRLSGFFAFVAAWAMKRAHTPLVLLCAITFITGLFSAFLVNDAICLVLAPIVLDVTRGMGRKPIPYLLAVAMSSNVGSVATITGNPQNIMIGSFSQIPYAHFALSLGPVAIAGLILTVVLIALFHRDEFASQGRLETNIPKFEVKRPLALRGLLTAALMVGLFFAGQPPAKVAIVLGSLLLLTRRVKSTRTYTEIDWPLLLMFTGLFIIVSGARQTLLTPDLVERVGHLGLDQVPVLTAVTAVLSNLVSNVPAVLMIKPFVEPLKNQETAWLVVAMASTLAGNFIILGSIANMIVVQKAAHQGVLIGFWEYFRVGAPLTVATLIIGTLWLCL
jgi:Na+/H+ antiporter NhaD/arsenite permease-like protein